MSTLKVYCVPKIRPPYHPIFAVFNTIFAVMTPIFAAPAPSAPLLHHGWAEQAEHAYICLGEYFT